MARFRTSSATTAKPLPALPARAASTAAFRARMLVWKAMSSMVLTILWISAERSLILWMTSVMFRILSLLSTRPSLTSREIWLAVCAPWAMRWTLSDTALMCPASTSTSAACSVEPWDSSTALAETCSAPEATSREAAWSWPITPLSWWEMASRESLILENSPV